MQKGLEGSGSVDAKFQDHFTFNEMNKIFNLQLLVLFHT